jgi:hypothetical protein
VFDEPLVRAMDQASRQRPPIATGVAREAFVHERGVSHDRGAASPRVRKSGPSDRHAVAAWQRAVGVVRENGKQLGANSDEFE